MKAKHIQKVLFVGALVVAQFLLVGLISKPSALTNGDNIFKLQQPPFISVARAETDAAPLGVMENEAGISAYFKSPTSINLNTARTIYRTIEVSTANYIIGSVAVPNYSESEDVHVYINKDGWVLAYYLVSDPSSKILDSYNYNGGVTISTKLEIVLSNAASIVGAPPLTASFYHFQYPNATNMMFITEESNNGIVLQSSSLQVLHSTNEVGDCIVQVVTLISGLMG